jgi:hypothetical protein
MNEHEVYEEAGYYNPVPEDSGSTSLVRIPEIQPVAIVGGNNRVMRRMERRVEYEATAERCKARLTSEVVMNTTALSALGDQCARAVPSAEKPIRHVINHYAASSAQRIADRW